MMQSEKEQAPGARNEGECPQDAPSVGERARVVHGSRWITRHMNGDHYGFTLCGLRIGNAPVHRITADEYFADAIDVGDSTTETLADVTCPACLEALGR